MRKIILYSACSLDSFIAGLNDEIDWLFHDQDYGYQVFIDGIDTTLMGNRTFESILSMSEFPYTDKHNFVFTRSVIVPNEHEPVSYISGDIVAFVSSLKKLPGKDIWLIGGGEINTLLLNAGLIDEMILSIHPVILGQGKPLFARKPKLTKFNAVDTKSFESGLIQVSLKKAT